MSKIRSYVLPMLRDKGGFKETLEAIADAMQDVDDKATLVYNWHDVDKAEGEILDLIGEFWGVGREYFDTSQYFRVNAEDVNVPKYFFFKKPTSTTVLPAGSLNDIQYRLKIKAKIGSVFSNKTRNDNLGIIKNMTFADEVIINKASPMMLDITIKGANIVVTNTMQDDIEGILGDGVGINNLIIEDLR